MTVVLDGKTLTIEKLERIAHHGEEVSLDPGALERIRTCRTMIEEKLEAREIMYGINTGIGELSEVALNDAQVRDFQKYLIYNHAAGTGAPASIEWAGAGATTRENDCRRRRRCRARPSPFRGSRRGTASPSSTARTCSRR